MVLIACVTVSTSRDGAPSLTPTYVNVVPGMSGNQGFVTRALKFDPGAAPRAVSAPAATPRTISAALTSLRIVPVLSQGGLAETEDELRVVGHLVRRPRRIEHELELDVVDARHLARDALDVTRDERARRAAHRRER